MNVRYQQPMYFNSQDEEGYDQITDFSWLIFNAYDEADIYDPKLQVRISPKTPDSFLRRVLEAIRGGNSSISIINDEVAFRTLRKCGATEEEARTFLISGCWDYTVKEREAKTIPFRLNMGKLLELAFNRGVDPETGYKLGCDTGDPAEFKTFADFRKAFEKQFDDILFYCMNIIEHFERKLDVINPANMYSATMREALEKGEDAYATGAKYCNTALCIGCLATAVDSLTAVRKFVFDRKLVSMKEFAAALAADWKGYETASSFSMTLTNTATEANLPTASCSICRSLSQAASTGVLMPAAESTRMDRSPLISMSSGAKSPERRPMDASPENLSPRTFVRTSA